MKDRRQHRRINFNKPVEIIYPNTKTEIAFINNISVEGLLILMDTELLPGDEITLLFCLPLSSCNFEIKLKSEILNVRYLDGNLKYQTHLKFVEINDIERAALNRYINQFSKRQAA